MCRGSVVMALAITTPGAFEDLTNHVEASNRGSRPHFGSNRSAQLVNISQLCRRDTTRSIISKYSWRQRPLEY